MGFWTSVNEQLFQNMSEVVAHHPWLLGAGGGNTIGFGKQELSIGLNIVAVLGGFFLLIPSVLHIVQALKGDNKDWAKVGINALVGAIGLVFAVVGGSGIVNILTKGASDFNVGI